ncbi:DUF448 domain-containing protein [Parvularcula sp. LCG005]|uniref:DUF448 domain-containing protein n=1 Tax=Parvularcula sp. LCG005 TaxID=3078805 RepID=UPI002943BA09|nr:DUF448 domain-containing protein [Parvularcula sp. LCG005]WOI53335.1 DUF448 domain-containing protein [Parvularcula sp. LCG005]
MPKPRHNDRKCIASGEALAPGAHAIRFVRTPDGHLMADLSEKLPGRGAWLSADAALLEKAIARGQFSRAFKAATPLPDDTDPKSFSIDLGDRLLTRVLNALGLARGAGQVVSGYDTVIQKRSKLIAYITPADAAPDGMRKVKQRLEPDRPVPHIELGTNSGTLSQALGEFGVVHVGLLPGKAANAALFEAQRWMAYIAAIAPNRHHPS